MKTIYRLLSLSFAVVAFTAISPGKAEAGNADNCIMQKTVARKTYPPLPRSPKNYWQVQVWNTCGVSVVADFWIDPNINSKITAGRRGVELKPGGENTPWVRIEALKNIKPSDWKLHWNASYAQTRAPVAIPPVLKPAPARKRYPSKRACVKAKGPRWCDANPKAWR